MQCRGIRGATLVQENTRTEILEKTRELLDAIISVNDIEVNDIASIMFTATSDVNAEYPALAARQLGWYDHALLCGTEISVPGSLEQCIRVLVHWNTTKPIHEVHHVYINGAEVLRPEYAAPPDDAHKSREQHNTRERKA